MKSFAGSAVGGPWARRTAAGVYIPREVDELQAPRYSQDAEFGAREATCEWRRLLPIWEAVVSFLDFQGLSGR